MVEFEDGQELEDWLETRTADEFSVFAARAAARAFPRFIDEKDWASKEWDLAILRSILVAFVGTVTQDKFSIRAAQRALERGPTLESELADRASKSAEYAAQTVAHSSWIAAADAHSFAIDAAFYENDSMISSMHHDASEIVANGARSLARLPLWQKGAHPDISYMSDVWMTERLANLSAWSFWISWYADLLKGREPDWPLWRDVALIEDAVWKEGAEAVARAIEGIKRKRMTAVVPPLTLDDSQQVYRVVHEPPLQGDTLGFAKSRTEAALANALDAGRSNGFTDESYEAVALRRALDEAEITASVLATSLYDACLALGDNIGDLYPDDASLRNLRNALFAAVDEICEQSEAARARCARLASIAVARQPKSAELDDLPQMAEVAGEAADAELTEIVSEDARLIARVGRAPKWVKARFLNYMTTLSGHLDKAKKGDAKVAWLAKRLNDLWEWLTTTPDV